ncbi:MAG: DUF2807 domain-containing protein [Bacteroidales bacterium]|nr:DUF2807 domain-containing protein [Bacteroidales bacterium]
MMKRISYFFLAIVLIATTTVTGHAQRLKGNKHVTKQERTIEEFTELTVSGALNVILTQGEPQLIIIESDENLLDQIFTDVKKGVLKLTMGNIIDFTELNIYITVRNLDNIETSGATSIKSTNQFKASSLRIQASGASEIKMNIMVDELETDISGASEVTLKGNANEHSGEISGASELNAYDLVTQNTTIDVSGAASAMVNAENSLNANTSGAGEVKYKNDPATLNMYNNDQIKMNNSSGTITIHTDDWDETTKIVVGGVSVEVTDDDSVKIVIGNNELLVDNNGNVKFNKCRKQKFNGHWGGFHLGVNGYLDKDWSTTIPNEETFGYLDLKYEKSIDVQLNFFEQNINLINNKFGLITGLGLTWNSYNYRRNDTYLVSDSSVIFGYYGKEGVEDNPAYPAHHKRNYDKSKMKVTYLMVPVLFEYQTNRFQRTNSFHITGGMVLGWRMWTKTKVLYKTSGTVKDKQWSDFHLQPFRFNAYAGIGWGVINLYGTYSINTLFRDNRGPELYPFSIGLTIVGW